MRRADETWVVRGTASCARRSCCSRRSSRSRHASPRRREPRRADRAGPASDCRVVGVTAPAGYGKSTLLAEWARAEDRPVAWVSLDRFDDDPAALLALLASAYARIVAGQRRPGRRHAAASGSRSSGGRRPPGGRVPDQPGPVRADAGRPARVAVARLPRRAGRGDLGDPAGSQLVAASRSEQPHLAAAAGGRRGAGVRGERPGPRRGRRRADLLAGAREPHPGAGGRGHRADRGLAGRPPPRRADRERDRRRALRSPATTATWPTTSTASRWSSCRRGRSGSCAAPPCSISSAPRCATRSSTSRARSEHLRDLEATNLFLVPLDRRRGGTATTRSSGSSCWASCAGSSPTSS